MLKVSELITLEEKMVTEGKTSIIEVMTIEEMVSYRENLLTWIKKRENKKVSGVNTYERNQKMISHYKNELLKIEEIKNKKGVEKMNAIQINLNNKPSTLVSLDLFKTAEDFHETVALTKKMFGEGEVSFEVSNIEGGLFHLLR